MRARLAGILLALVALLAVAAPAFAAPDQTSGREITRYDVTATIAADGVTTVDLDFDFDFGDDPGHGPYLTFVTRVHYDDQHDRAFEYSNVTASSSTGAPAQVNKETTDSALILRIGDPNNDSVSGVQTYHVQFLVDGWVNPANPQHSGDELYWNVIGPGWEVPIGAVTVQVTGPAAVQDAICFAGPHGSTTPCTSAVPNGNGAAFTQDLVPVGDELTTVTGWPGGTFPGVEPILVAKPDPLAPVQPVTPLGIGALVVLVAGVAFAVRRVRRAGRDQAYLGLTPGLRPADGQPGNTGFRDKRGPVSVQFEPPAGMVPGEVGTLVDEKADPVDVTATLVDLAVKGWLRIEEVPRSNPNKKAKDWTLVQLKNRDGSLLPFEDTLLMSLFAGRTSVQLSDLRTTFASSMAKVQDGLYDDVTAKGWFRANPKSVRALWKAAGITLLVVAGILGFIALKVLADVRGSLLIPIAIGIIGVAVFTMSNAAPARTADGTAALAQSMGFRRYLATAEANQLRFEEGEDIFSRYLPYAIVFGLADRWARVFSELAAQGRSIAQPGWYVGGYYPGSNIYWASAFASSLDRFSSIATESISAPTPGSSGGSGFSGGGFSGGGVGGGGGGGW
ncbi:DUF2207 domain-containing protein [Cellulomonas sp. URHD0024]|uniref:DUF2207 domain-containing protein n=1 Tax=Cellulomonas sp. URHD0024 TaxID=1302620 RepID=UPI0003F9808C|nr:DUF2207 domain-containing protein [Cellulomonas sp. URHD0024]